MDVNEYAYAVERAVEAAITGSSAFAPVRARDEEFTVTVDLAPDDTSGKSRLQLTFDVEPGKIDYDTSDVTATVDYVVADYES